MGSNDAERIAYFDRLTEIANSLLEWKGLPETVDARFLELSLFYTKTANT